MNKLFQLMMLMLAVGPVLMAWRSISFVTERSPLNLEHLDSTDTPSVSDQDPAVAVIEAGSRSQDSTELQIVMYERDPMTGARFFSVNGSPVQGRLKAYLDAATEKQELTVMVNHPDGESYKWVEIPLPLFLSLTDQSPSP